MSPKITKNVEKKSPKALLSQLLLFRKVRSRPENLYQSRQNSKMDVWKYIKTMARRGCISGAPSRARVSPGADIRVCMNRGGGYAARAHGDPGRYSPLDLDPGLAHFTVFCAKPHEEVSF